MKLLVSGLNGHMGREVAALLKANYRGMELSAGVDINDIEQDGVPCAKTDPPFSAIIRSENIYAFSGSWVDWITR